MGGLSAYASASTSSRPDTSWAGIAVICFPSQEQASLQTRLPAPVQGTRSRVARLLDLEVTADSSSRGLSCASSNAATPDGSCDHGDNARVGFWLFLLWAVRPRSSSAGEGDQCVRFISIVETDPRRWPTLQSGLEFPEID